MKKLLFIFLLLPLFSSSQDAKKKKNIVPGYLGKKLEFNYKLATFPVIKRFGEDFYMIDGEYPQGIGIFGKHQFYLNYTVGRKVSLGINYSFSNSHIYLFRSVEQSGQGYSVYHPYKPFFSRYKGINIRVFTRNFFAPVGIYHQAEIGTIDYGLRSDSLHFYGYTLNQTWSGSYDTVLVKIGMKEKYSSTYFRYGLNISSTFAKRFLFTAGMSIGYVFGGDGAASGKDGTGPSAAKYIPYSISKYLRYEQLFNYHLGLGVLIF